MAQLTEQLSNYIEKWGVKDSEVQEFIDDSVNVELDRWVASLKLLIRVFKSLVKLGRSYQ